MTALGVGSATLDATSAPSARTSTPSSNPDVFAAELSTASSLPTTTSAMADGTPPAPATGAAPAPGQLSTSAATATPTTSAAMAGSDRPAAAESTAGSGEAANQAAPQAATSTPAARPAAVGAEVVGFAVAAGGPLVATAATGSVGTGKAALHGAHRDRRHDASAAGPGGSAAAMLPAPLAPVAPSGAVPPSADAANILSSATQPSAPAVLGVTGSPGPVPVDSPRVGSATSPTGSAAAISGPSTPNTGGVAPAAAAPTATAQAAAAAPVLPATATPLAALPLAAAGSGAAVAADGAQPAAAKSRPGIPGLWVQPGAVTLTPTSTVAAANQAASPQAATSTPAPLNAQLAPALFQLRDAGAGTHVLTLTVAPEAVGPVTVRAHVEASGIRIELSAPTEHGRNALDAMLPDLRRDLSQGGMNSSLSLAAGTSDGSGGGRSAFDAGGGSFARDPGRDSPVPAGHSTHDSRPLSAGPSITLRSGAAALDVLA